MHNYPPKLKEQCIAVCSRLGLEFGGIDLRITREGAIYCFEINPSPGYTYYERAADLPITSALVSLLANER
jgi:D-alanine-D-alanine ligase-like ATP-grasp enzyme